MPGSNKKLIKDPSALRGIVEGGIPNPSRIPDVRHEVRDESSEQVLREFSLETFSQLNYRDSQPSNSPVRTSTSRRSIHQMPIARRLALIPIIISSLTFAQTKTPATSAAPVSITTLRQNFLDPPDDAKPMMRWWWFGTAVEKPEILRELEQMKADGIGGVELAFVYPMTLDDPAKGLVNHPFLSP